MINWTRTNMIWSVSRKVVAAQVGNIQEGMAAVSALDGGQIKIQPSTGATSGISGRIEGIFMSPRRTFATNLTAQVVTAPAGGGTVLLNNTVVSNADIGAFLATTGVQTAVTTGAASSTNIQSATDATTGLTSLTFDVSMAGNTYNVFFTYVMSPLVEQGIYGNGSPGFWASDVLSSVGLFKVGRIALNNFDPVANWYSGVNAPGIKVIAGGLFTDSGSASAGFVPTNVDIVAFPTPANPWLELEIH